MFPIIAGPESIRALTTKAIILGASLALISVAQAQAPQPFRVISPIFGQLVTISMPSNFAVVFENTKVGHYIREAVLKGETSTRAEAPHTSLCAPGWIKTSRAAARSMKACALPPWSGCLPLAARR